MQGCALVCVCAHSFVPAPIPARSLYACAWTGMLMLCPMGAHVYCVCEGVGVITTALFPSVSPHVHVLGWTAPCVRPACPRQQELVIVVVTVSPLIPESLYLLLAGDYKLIKAA